MNNNKPVQEFRYGYARATVWLNQTSSGVMYNVTVSRSYKDKETDQWGDSSSFGDLDLPALAKAVNDAHTWIYQQKAAAQVSSVDSEAA